jgi:membrane-associated PAP2 superfamily phosphatase
MNIDTRKMLFLLAFSCALLVCLQQFTAFDLTVENWYFDADSHRFPWKNSWFAKDFMHGYLKNAIMLPGIAIVVFCAVDYFFPSKKVGSLMRLRLQFVGFSAVIIPAFIAGLKSKSASHCPWNVEQYGGIYPHLKLFESLPPTMQAGHCFPAGHTSTGLWLTAFCIFWLPNAPKKALLVFTLGLSVGFVLGWVQQMRGAHFLSHTLWSMWLASLVIVCLLMLFRRAFAKHYNNQNEGGK